MSIQSYNILAENSNILVKFLNILIKISNVLVEILNILMKILLFIEKSQRGINMSIRIILATASNLLSFQYGSIVTVPKPNLLSMTKNVGPPER